VHKKPAKNSAAASKARQPKPQLKTTPAPVDAKKSPAPSHAEELAQIAASIKSNIRNTLLASPYFPRLYADVVISSAPNSNEAKNIAANYQKIVDMTNVDGNNRTIMPVQASVKTCTHIKVTGIRCGSPALRGEQFCYFHQRMVRGVSTPPNARLHPVALIENEEAIQSSLMEVINALARNTIDLKRAELMLRALHIAVKNARRVRFDVGTSDMVREVPTYPAPPQAAMPPVRDPAIEINPKPWTPLDEIMRHTADPDPEPTERKPPARAGLPPEKKKAALQKGDH
jgi:hypothetical protein